jgi:hypothetical protein
LLVVEGKNYDPSKSMSLLLKARVMILERACPVSKRDNTYLEEI